MLAKAILERQLIRLQQYRYVYSTSPTEAERFFPGFNDAVELLQIPNNLLQAFMTYYSEYLTDLSCITRISNPFNLRSASHDQTLRYKMESFFWPICAVLNDEFHDVISLAFHTNAYCDDVVRVIVTAEPTCTDSLNLTLAWYSEHEQNNYFYVPPEKVIEYIKKIYTEIKDNVLKLLPGYHEYVCPECGENIFSNFDANDAAWLTCSHDKNYLVRADRLAQALCGAGGRNK